MYRKLISSILLSMTFCATGAMQVMDESFSKHNGSEHNEHVSKRKCSRVRDRFFTPIVGEYIAIEKPTDDDLKRLNEAYAHEVASDLTNQSFLQALGWCGLTSDDYNSMYQGNLTHKYFQDKSSSDCRLYRVGHGLLVLNVKHFPVVTVLNFFEDSRNIDETSQALEKLWQELKPKRIWFFESVFKIPVWQARGFVDSQELPDCSVKQQCATAIGKFIDGSEKIITFEKVQALKTFRGNYTRVMVRQFQ